MIIPATIKTDPEKVVVIDVPLDTTIIIRTLDNQNKATMYHVTDMSIVDQSLGNPALPPPPPQAKGTKKNYCTFCDSL
jgi:hypothetical protein